MSTIRGPRAEKLECRPGLSGFLQKMSEMFELHVYTAGTRTYANAICSCIDPTGKLFSERILSRNESGSASTKSLKRLFPTDESMVVVIDDRWEVWAHGKNLVKVIPCEFRMTQCMVVTVAD